MTDGRKDTLKAMRLNAEGDFISQEWVEKLAETVTNDLVAWTNEAIFKPLGGELTYTMDLFGAPNATAKTFWAKPYSPQIIIRQSMIKEIYRDAFTFPLISRRIAKETNNIQDVNNMFESLKVAGAPYTFRTGVPQIPQEVMRGNLAVYFAIYSQYYFEVHKGGSAHQPSENEIACRFLMFELLLVWTFFHELGHVVQRHNMLAIGKADDLSDSLSIDEMVSSTVAGDINVSAQAREILADIEGLNFTLKYMQRKGMYGPETIYLLLCAQNCMFNRFYEHNEESLELVVGTHPHPSIRNEFAHNFILLWVLNKLSCDGEAVDKEKQSMPLIYLSVRSSFMSGLFWASRVEVFDGSKLPSYMRLSTPEHHAKRLEYIDTLARSIEEQLVLIKQIHMCSQNAISLFETSPMLTPGFSDKPSYDNLAK